MAAGLEESFGGGGYTALQRAALLQMAWDHVSSGLDGRESAFELHANGGMPIWRGRVRRAFDRYNELANAVLRQAPVPMPEIDLERAARGVAYRSAPGGDAADAVAKVRWVSPGCETHRMSATASRTAHARAGSGAAHLRRGSVP